MDMVWKEGREGGGDAERRVGGRMLMMLVSELGCLRDGAC